jgi:hypothetical protein
MSKISKEELDQLNQDEQKFAAIKHDIGTLVLQAFGLCNAFGQVQKPNIEFKQKLEEEYGKININLKDGSYEEIKEDKE